MCGRRGFFNFTGYNPSSKEAKAGDRKQELKQWPWRKLFPACSQAHIQLRFLPRTKSRPPAEEWQHPQWVSPHHVNQQLRKHLTDMSTGQSDEGKTKNWDTLFSSDNNQAQSGEMAVDNYL